MVRVSRSHFRLRLPHDQRWARVAYTASLKGGSVEKSDRFRIFGQNHTFPNRKWSQDENLENERSKRSHHWTWSKPKPSPKPAFDPLWSRTHSVFKENIWTKRVFIIIPYGPAVLLLCRTLTKVVRVAGENPKSAYKGTDKTFRTISRSKTISWPPVGFRHWLEFGTKCRNCRGLPGRRFWKAKKSGLSQKFKFAQNRKTHFWARFSIKAKSNSFRNAKKAALSSYFKA